MADPVKKATYLFTLFVMCITFAFATVGAAIFMNERAQKKTNNDICHAINSINSSLSGSLKRSAHNLPKLTYYQAHPKELDAQIKEIEQELLVYRPRTC